MRVGMGQGRPGPLRNPVLPGNLKMGRGRYIDMDDSG